MTTTVIPQFSNLVDYSKIQSITQIWQITAKNFGNKVALYDPHSKPAVKLTYSQLSYDIQLFASGLQSLGVQPDSKVSLFADNSPRWLIADQGIMSTGAANVVRSSQAEKQELLYILEDSDSTALVVEDIETLQKLQPELSKLPLKLVVLLTNQEPNVELSCPVLNYQQLLKTGIDKTLISFPSQKNDLATLIYTSGTTGQPKGVMLTHGNFLHQIVNFAKILQPQAGDRTLTILPTWHAYERTAEYYLLSQGCEQIYTNLRSVKKDLKEFKPQFMVGVPRLWESIYEGIQKNFKQQPANQQKLINFCLTNSEKYVRNRAIAQNLSLEHYNTSAQERLTAKLQATLIAPIHALGEKIVYGKVREATGGKLKAVISGGGSLAKHIDDFFEIIGVPLLVGYGLTETSPVTNVRTLDHNVKGSSGRPITDTQIKIVDLETRQTLPQGQKGLVLIKGPQVMQGYYKKPEATAKAIDADGWFDSGDLGWLTPDGDLVITGRAKDTIVLSNGENIEPQPIEDACVRSPYIDQIMVVGQDQKALGALIVPNFDNLKQWAKDQNLNLNFPDASASWEEVTTSDLHNEVVKKLFRQELTKEVQNRPGYRVDDRITVFTLIAEPFSIDNGMMTQTMKIKRPVVTEHYHAIINKMFV